MDREQMNLQGLLRFALNQAQAPDGLNGSAANLEMDDERKQFLENAFKAMTVDIIKEFENAVNTLEDVTTSTADKLNALNLIREHVDNIDFANDFVKVGGSTILLKCLKADQTEIRVNTIQTIAEMCQNNPFCQSHFVAVDLIPILVSHFDECEDVASSALYAVSAMTRNFQPGLSEFVRIGGIESVVNCLSTNFSRVFIKACFLIACLSAEYSAVRDEFVQISTITELIKHVEPVAGFNIKIETVLFALSELSKSGTWKPEQELQQNISILLSELIELNANFTQCERKQFLENAFKAMTVDIIKEFENAVNTLEDVTTSTADKLNALNLIREHVDNIDFANDFVKVGGSTILLKCLKADQTEIRVNTIQTIAEMCQNNPFCQSHFVAVDLIPILVSHFDECEDVASSALYAVSAMTRNFQPGLSEFVRIGGIESVVNCLSTNFSRVFIKACFLIACLSAEYSAVRDEFVQISTITELIKHVEPVAGFNIKIETVLFALSELSKSGTWKPEQELQQNISILLSELIELNANFTQCEEMVIYAKSILGIINVHSV